MRLIDSITYCRDIDKALQKIDLTLLENKTVAVTGGLGLIGSAIVDLLWRWGKTKLIMVCARDENVFARRYGDSEGLVFVEYDALSPVEFPDIPDYIIVGAGIASPDLYVSSPVETMLSNFLGVLNLLQYSKEKNVKRLLYISSSEVYGKKENELPFEEGKYGFIDIDDLRSSYPIGKRSSEMICKAFSSEYAVETVIVRPGHVYGPTATTKDKRISSEFAFRAAKGENLMMKSTGLQKRSYCYSVDCVVQMLFALTKGKVGEAYNVGHDEITTIREMARIYALAGNVQLTISDPTEEELKAFNPMNNSSLSNEKIKSLGYRDTFSVEEGLTHTVQILRELLEFDAPN